MFYCYKNYGQGDRLFQLLKLSIRLEDTRHSEIIILYYTNSIEAKM